MTSNPNELKIIIQEFEIIKGELQTMKNDIQHLKNNIAAHDTTPSTSKNWDERSKKLPPTNVMLEDQQIKEGKNTLFGIIAAIIVFFLAINLT